MELIITEIRTLRNPDPLGSVLEPATFIRFVFDYCEFDFFSEAPGYLEGPAVYAQEKQMVKIPIKIGRIRERNSYGLLGALLSDTVGAAERGREAGLKNFTPITTVKDASGVNVNNQAGIAEGFKRASFINRRATAESAFQNQPGNAYGNPPRADLGLLGQVATGALSALQNAAQNLANRAILGNVYGFSLGTLTGQLSGILNNPIAAVQGIASSFTSNQQQATDIARRVELSGPDIQLIKNFVGAVDYVRQVSPGVNLDNVTLGDLITGITPSQNLQGSPSNANLQAANIPTQPPGKEQLVGPTLSNTPPGREVLKGPNIMNTMLGRILFEGSGTTEGNPGKTILSAPSTSLEGNPGKESLDSAPSQPGGASKVDLISPTVEGFGSTKQEFISNGASINGNPGATMLEAPNASLSGRAENVNLEASPVNQKVQPSVELESPPKGGLDGAPKVRLESPPITPTDQPGNVDLEGPFIRKNELGNAELE